MIKLKIKNIFEEIGTLYNDVYSTETKNFVMIRRIEEYDETKWKNNAIYEFNTLKELKHFIDTCEIDFTEEYAERFDEWSWEEIDRDLYIDDSEDNLMIFVISAHDEWRD